MKYFLSALLILFVIQTQAFARPTKPVHLDCEARESSQNWYKHLTLRGFMLRSGTLVITLSNGSEQNFEASIRPASTDGSGVQATVNDDRWPLVFSYTEDKNGILYKADEPARKFPFSCR